MSGPNEPNAVAQDKPVPGVIEWLWQPTRERQLRTRPEVRDPATSELLRRARLTLSIANRLVEAPEPFDDGDPAPVAAALYREAVYFSLLAHERAADEKRDVDGATAYSREKLDELWNAAETGLVQTVAGGSEAAKARRALLDLGSFGAPDAPSSVAPERLKALREFVEALVRTVDAPRREFENLGLARLVRVGVPVLVLLVTAVGLGTWLGVRPIAGETDLPWRTSSTYEPEPGCTSPSQSCDNANFFFCTNEEDNPWIEFDLGTARKVARVDVVNRTDNPGIMARAVPLVLEVSTDRQNWRPAARRDQVFESWSARLEGTTARWVRLRASRRTFLHLREVRIRR